MRAVVFDGLVCAVLNALALFLFGILPLQGEAESLWSTAASSDTATGTDVRLYDSDPDALSCGVSLSSSRVCAGCMWSGHGSV
jgi:hypothetical protein